MKISEAQDELKKITYQWLDFTYWASLQLYARGLDSDGKEYTRRMELAIQLHKAREAELEAYRERKYYEVMKMELSEVSGKEINAFLRSRQEEGKKLLDAWRSLD
jgi:hypothetical protein